MRALTISQPWADLIASGEKWIENRPRLPPEKLIGERIAIHAGKGVQYLSRHELRRYRTGVVIATARIVTAVDLEFARECAEAERVPAVWQRAGLDLADLRRMIADRYCEGPYCIILDSVEALAEPIPARGQLGYWRWEPSSVGERSAGMLF